MALHEAGFIFIIDKRLIEAQRILGILQTLYFVQESTRYPELNVRRNLCFHRVIVRALLSSPYVPYYSSFQLSIFSVFVEKY